MRSAWPVLLFAVVAACNDYSAPVGGGGVVAPPADLIYQVEPSGTPGAPSGVLLLWSDDGNPNLAVWHVYSRGSTSGPFKLRGSTTSVTFHDNGIPDLQYYVTAEDIGGFESAPSPVITVDERLALENPNSLTTTSLNGAIALTWSDNPFTSEPNGFQVYRVYSTRYDLDNDLCDNSWSLEGTTVAPEFIAAALPNGSPRCFGVSAISVEGFESLWSPIRQDTPRPDARNVVLYVRQDQDANSGFRFWNDVNGNLQSEPSELGFVTSGSSPAIDFSVERGLGGALFLTPVRPSTTAAVYGSVPVGDLTNIDFAPAGGYGHGGLEALPGWGYVFQMDGGDGFARFGAIRVTHVGQSFIIVDWSFQTDPGNIELIVASGTAR